MAILTITIPDAEVNNLLDAIAYFYPITGGMTKPQWARKHVKTYLNTILNRHKNYIAKQAVNIPLDNTIVDVT